MTNQPTEALKELRKKLTSWGYNATVDIAFEDISPNVERMISKTIPSHEVWVRVLPSEALDIKTIRYVGDELVFNSLTFSGKFLIRWAPDNPAEEG